MLPILLAEESLSAANRTAVGAGTLSEEDRKAVTGGWVDAIKARLPPAARAPQGPTPGQLSRYKIGVRKVKRKKPEPADGR